jgi:hypothetical protein
MLGSPLVPTTGAGRPPAAAAAGGGGGGGGADVATALRKLQGGI